jgi:nitrite reductase/ring-hydroxylating ferredoxin subunit
MLLVVLGAICLAFPIAEASATLFMAKNPKPSLGAVLTQSSKIKVGQTQVYIGKQPSGQTIEVILTRTKKGLVALDGTCSAQGDKVVQKKSQLICPNIGSVYQAATGAVVLGPKGSPKNSIPPLTRFTVTEKSGNIYVK